MRFAAQEVRKIMDNKENIRNMSVCGHLGVGKTILTDSFVAAAGIISQEAVGDSKVTDTRSEDAARRATFKATGISLCYTMSDESLKDYKSDSMANVYLINLVDSPGHVEFSHELSASLRITDGVLFVVDCTEGVCSQTEAVLRQVLTERVKPVLAINKLDRYFLELQVDGEEAYQRFQRIIQKGNAIMGTGADPSLGDVHFCPEDGSVVFCSGLHGWGFSLTSFAKIYASMHKVDGTRIRRKLWGDNFYDPDTKKWTINHTGSRTCKRGFVRLVYEPIMKIIETCMNHDAEKLLKMLQELGVTVKAEQIDLPAKSLMKAVMHTWLPASSPLLEMLIFHLPSPSKSQRYRSDIIYSGPPGDVYADAVRECSPEGPVMVYVPKFVPSPDKNRLFAFVRVFSGKVSIGMNLRIVGPNQGENDSLQRVQGVRVCMGKGFDSFDDVPCGNLVVLVGLDDKVTKGATLVGEKELAANTFRALEFSGGICVRVAVRCKFPSDFLKLKKGLRSFSKSDIKVLCTYDEDTREFIVAGSGELHVETCLKELDGLVGVELIRSDPIFSYRETVIELSSQTVTSKSKQRCSRLYVKARPFELGLTEAIDAIEGTVRKDILAEQFGWDNDFQKKIWSFGPEGCEANMIINLCEGAGELNEIRVPVEEAFHHVSVGGVLAKEPLRGVAFEIHNVVSLPDSGELISSVEKTLNSAQLSAKPRLLEPLYRVEIKAPTNTMNEVCASLKEARGNIVDANDDGSEVNVKGYLPFGEALGFSHLLRSATKGKASFFSAVDGKWALIHSDPLQPESEAAKIVEKIKRRKGFLPGNDVHSL